MPSPGDSLQLIHPVYIDVPMMVGFVAALEGGVSYGAEQTERAEAARAREREGTARFGLPMLSSILNLDMSGRLTGKSEDANSQETKIVRRHTEASLLNLLRHRRS